MPRVPRKFRGGTREDNLPSDTPQVSDLTKQVGNRLHRDTLEMEGRQEVRGERGGAKALNEIDAEAKKYNFQTSLQKLADTPSSNSSAQDNRRAKAAKKYPGVQ